jgi:type I restriction enzyme S subunit
LYGDDVPYDHIRINSGMVIIQTDPSKLLPAFLYGFLRSPRFKSQVEQLRSGVAQPQLPIRDLNKIKIPLPRKEVQERIVSILSAYDDLVENNNQRIKLLEESARLLYQEWFVRLRFPGYEHTFIVDGVPEGWEQKTLRSLGEITTGKTPSTKRREYFGGNIPFIKTPDMHGNVYVVTAEDTLSDEGAETQKNKFLDKNAIIVACIGAKAGVVSLTINKSQTNQQINAISVYEDTKTFYLYFFLKDFKEQLLAIGSSGSTMPNVSKGKFENIAVLVPQKRLLSVYHEIVSASFEQILNLQLSNQKLRAARDFLLPRLMSGEIGV